MNLTTPFAGPARDPISALLADPRDAVLAVITRVEGPSYRPVGAAMTIFMDGDRAGTLSSGCIESDLVLHAQRVLQSGQPETLLYGRGSPFIDIQLPCGGGLEILMLPKPDESTLRQVAEARSTRRPCTLEIDTISGSMSLCADGETGKQNHMFRVRYVPDVRFLVFGKGPEASTFSALVQSAGYPNLLLSPDHETLDAGESAGCDTRHLLRQAMPDDLAPDPWTAIILFFHDHDWEPPILEQALKSRAFYIGSQGSQRARDARLLMLEAMGVEKDSLHRLHGPVGLIPSARDAGTLAVSVLAEILAVAMREAT